MTDIASKFRDLTDVVADTVAREVAALQREAARDRELRDAEHRAAMAELTAAIASTRETERRLADRLATLKDGEPGRDGIDGTNGRDADPELIGTMVARAVAELPSAKDGRDGKDADPVEIVRLLVPEVERRFVENPVFRGEKGNPGADGRDGADGAAGKDGIDGVNGKDGLDGAPGKDGKDGAAGKDGEDAPAPTMEQVTEAVREMLPDVVAKAVADHLCANPPPAGRDGKDGLDGVNGKDGADGNHGKDGQDGRDGTDGRDGRDGKLPLVKDWTDGVHYEGDVVFHDGGTWQALRDTGREPPHADWQCLAKAGRDGEDGRSFTVRGTWGEGTVYRALDVVALNGGAFVARKDDPGQCPGEGWQMLAMQGKPGRPGERGIGSRGERGEAGPPVVTMSVNDEGLITLVNADGSEVTCDLYPLLAKLG